MATYITKQLDRLDRICDAYYGTANNGFVEFVIENNPGLDLQGIVLPQGLSINLPDRANPQEEVRVIKQIHLWS